MPRWIRVGLVVVVVLVAGTLAACAYVWANLATIVADRATKATGP